MVRNVQGYRSFTLHVLYNPLRQESVAAKAQMIHSVEAIFEACKSPRRSLGASMPVC